MTTETPNPDGWPPTPVFVKIVDIDAATPDDLTVEILTESGISVVRTSTTRQADPTTVQWERDIAAKALQLLQEHQNT